VLRLADGAKLFHPEPLVTGNYRRVFLLERKLMSDCSSREEDGETDPVRWNAERARGLMAVPADPSVLVLASHLISSSISHERDWDFLISSRRQLARRPRI